MTQEVAYGTFTMRDPDNQKVKIARVIRQRQDEELCRQIIAYLKENDFEAPGRSTILKILKMMIAGTSKEMKGINFLVEESNKAFRTLERIIKDLSAVMNEEYSEDDFAILLSAVRIAQKYYKSHYIYNLSKHNVVASHCLQHSCSDPEDSDFQTSCHEDHEGDCDWCKLIPDIMRVLEFMLPYFLEHKIIEEDKYQEFLYDIQEAHQKIFNYKGFILRNQMQNGEWEKQMQKKIPTQAFMTIDWAMKYLPKKFRFGLIFHALSNGFLMAF